MAPEKMCAWDGKQPATHLGPMEIGPVFGLELQGETGNYCSHECWEAQLQFNRRMADEKS